jgi:hypothetical protein
MRLSGILLKRWVDENINKNCLDVPCKVEFMMAFLHNKKLIFV